MRTLFGALLLAALTTTALGQGKVTFGNDSNHLIVCAQQTIGGVCGSLAGLPLPQVNSQYACNLGNFTSQLLAGTSVQSMMIASTVRPAGLAGLADGRLANTPVTLVGIPPGSPAFFRVRIWWSAAGSYESATAQGLSGESPIFTVVPGTLVGPPIASPLAPGNSTWANGPIFIGACLGPCLGPIWGFPTNRTVHVGDSATFSVGIAACPPTQQYQWYFNGTPIPGAMDSGYQVINAQPTNAGVYEVEVRNEICTTSHLSFSATLTVVVPLTILVPPQSQTAEMGSKAIFAVQASGNAGMTYQWFFNDTVPVSAATTNSHLQLSNVQMSQSGSYQVVVSDSYGAVTSAAAFLGVIAPVSRSLVPGIAIRAQPNSLMNVDYRASGDPGEGWTSFPTFYFTNAPQFFFDLSEPLPPRRLYRAWQSNVVSTPITLAPYLVPAIQLTGPLGATYRIDYINQFGPMDAWVPLTTNTLTSPSQLYFDTSSIGQLPRLWRIVTVP